MRTRQPTTTTLENLRIPVQAKLAAAWTSFMFLYVYVDIIAFFKPGVVDDILVGVLWEFDISQTLLTAFLALMAIPIFMVVLSMTLPARANRITNLIVASVQVPYAAFNAVGESWTYFYGLGVALEVIVLALILRYAWTWPAAPHHRRPWQPASTASHSARRSRRDCPPRARPSFARATRGHGHLSQRSLLSTPSHPIPQNGPGHDPGTRAHQALRRHHRRALPQLSRSRPGPSPGSSARTAPASPRPCA